MTRIKSDLRWVDFSFPVLLKTNFKLKISQIVFDWSSYLKSFWVSYKFRIWPVYPSHYFFWHGYVIWIWKISAVFEQNEHKTNEKESEAELVFDWAPQHYLSSVSDSHELDHCIAYKLKDELKKHMLCKSAKFLALL